jgi:hypothetical protein
MVIAVPIEFACPNCGTVLNVPDDRAGAKGKCRACGQMVTAPGAPPPTDPLPDVSDMVLDDTPPAKAATPPTTAPPADQTLPRSGYAPSAPRPPLTIPRHVSIMQVLSDLGGALGRHGFMLVLASCFVQIALLFCGLVWPAFVVGYCDMCLGAIRGEDVEFGDLFEGFSSLLPAYGVALAVAFVSAAVIFLVGLPFGILTPAGGPGSGPVPIGAVWATWISLFALAPFYWLVFPAVADGADIVEALRFSILAGYRNWPTLMLISFLVSAAAAGIVFLAVVTAGAGHGAIAFLALLMLGPGVYVSMCSAYNQVEVRESAETA